MGKFLFSDLCRTPPPPTHQNFFVQFGLFLVPSTTSLAASVGTVALLSVFIKSLLLACAWE